MHFVNLQRFYKANNLQNNLQKKQFTKRTIYKMTSMFSCFSSSEEDSETEQHYKKEDPMSLWNEKYGPFIIENPYINLPSFYEKKKMKICIDDFIPFFKISSDVLSWGDYQIDSEETKGTDEYEVLQEHLKESIKQERKTKQQEKKRIVKEAREKKIKLQKEKIKLQKEKERLQKEKERKKKRKRNKISWYKRCRTRG